MRKQWTPQELALARRMGTEGWPLRKIAGHFGVSYVTIRTLLGLSGSRHTARYEWDYLKIRGMTQQEAASRLGCSRSRIQDLCRYILEKL